MIEGTYRATIRCSSLEKIWYGTISLENSEIAGSDDDNYYSFQGRYEDNPKIKLEILVSQIRENPLDTLSSLRNYTVLLEGTRGWEHLDLNGYVAQEPEKKLNVTLSKQRN